jgi:dolichol-phosphate mannosyltransferase
METIHYSVVVPVFNEEEVLANFYQRLTKVLESLKSSYEVIFVDDGSKDRSFSLLESFRKKDEHIKIIKLARNFGHHIALTAALDHTRGQAVILMDADLQDPPEEIPKLCAKFNEGYDIVYAIRKIRKDPFLKKVISKFFHKVFKILVKVETPADAGIFRIISRQVVDSLKSCREKSRFITALMSWVGFTHIGVETQRDARQRGKAKYNLCKSIALAIDGITSFSYLPLRIAIYIGFFVSLFSFVIGIYMLIKKLFFGMPVLGYASIIVSVFFIGGIQLFILGVMGEYIGRIYTETQGRPLYIVKEKLGIE